MVLAETNAELSVKNCSTEDVTPRMLLKRGMGNGE